MSARDWKIIVATLLSALEVWLVLSPQFSFMDVCHSGCRWPIWWQIVWGYPVIGLLAAGFLLSLHMTWKWALQRERETPQP